MAIYCPLVNRKVIYLDCLECEDKVCKKRDTKIIQKDKSGKEKEKSHK